MDAFLQALNELNASTTFSLCTPSLGDSEAFHKQLLIARLEDLSASEGKEKISSRLHAIRGKNIEANRMRLLEAALAAKTSSQKVIWLRREADQLTNAAAGMVACRKGCAQCCHISVTVAEAEARLMARELGIELKSPPPDRVFEFEWDSLESLSTALGHAVSFQDDLVERTVGIACPFLSVDGEGQEVCGIYDSRPLACRNVLNLDDDALLCRLVRGVSLPVPYVNRELEKAMALALTKRRTVIADIREWFDPISA